MAVKRGRDADEITLKRAGRVAVWWGMLVVGTLCCRRGSGRIEQTLIVPTEALRISDSNTGGRGALTIVGNLRVKN